VSKRAEPGLVLSRLFDRPSTGRIAVKVINDYGDEVTKVFDVPS
jgi:adenine-specific DNA-methyltransferase